MGPFRKHWIDWLMNDLLPAARGRPHGQAVHVRYESAGLTLYDAAVPWNADAAIVEVLLRLPPAARIRTDFTLRVPGRDSHVPEALRPDDSDPRRYRLHFRLNVPGHSVKAELLWKNTLLTTLPLTVLTAADFLAGLTLSHPTMTVRIGNRSVAARTFVATQCRGITAAAMLKSRTALVPLASLGLRVVFRSERNAEEIDVPIALSASQLLQKEILVTASPPKSPRRAGGYSATWYAGDRELLTMKVQGVSRKQFAQSLRVSDARFVVIDKSGVSRVVRHPPGAEAMRFGPCFVLCSREAGMAGEVTLHAVPLPANSGRPPMECTVLITDGPTVVAPGTLDSAGFEGVSGFELHEDGRSLGAISLNPVPTAIFTAEGGFAPPPEFTWTATADEELSERLTRLMRGEP